MSFQILVNSVDRTEYLQKGSLSIEDVLTSQVDTASFSVKNKDWIPRKGDEVLIYFDLILEFGGRITDVKKSDTVFRTVDVECVDWAVDLDRKKIAKVYDNMTAKEIIEDIIDTVNTEMGMSFTTTNVHDTQVLGKVVFNYQEASKCIEELANVLNWHWYIDALKDIHFFAKGMEISPFNVTDTSLDVIRESLQLDDSFSELRNVVILRGGDFVGSERTETYVSDGSQLTFNLAYKFSNLPVVEVEGTPIPVGVENLNNQELEDETFTALWDYNQKYLRFKISPTAGHEITITGTPLFPLIVLAEDANSIAEFGRKEHIITDNLITSVDVAIERCSSDLAAYKNGVQSGGFRTYTNGLKSGQTINVNSTKFDVSETFLIRSVRMVEFGNEKAEYQVELASNKVIGIIEFLQSLLLGNRKRIGIRENEVPNIIKLDFQDVEVEEQVTRISSSTDFQDVEIEEEIRVDPFEAIFVFAPYFPVDDSDPHTPMIFDESSYLYPP
jgi:hypothetical protein